MRASIVLLAADDPAATVDTLTMLSRLPEDPPFEVIVVADACTDEMGWLLEQLEGDVTPLCLDDRVGAAAAFDQGVAHATGDIVVLATCDGVYGDGWYDALLSRCEQDEHAAVLARTLGASGTWHPPGAWVALALHRSLYLATGGMAAAATPGVSVKRSLLDAIEAAGGAVDDVPAAVVVDLPMAA